MRQSAHLQVSKLFFGQRYTLWQCSHVSRSSLGGIEFETGLEYEVKARTRAGIPLGRRVLWAELRAKMGFLAHGHID